MIIDGRRNDDVPETSYDLVIIGAGPAGITLAHELRETGLRIALLESGGEDYDDGMQALNRGRIEGNDDEYDLEFSRLRHLGGTSNHWGGQCTPLDEIDFERAWNGLSGWPFSRSELDPYYARAHEYCDLGRYVYAFEELAPNDPDYRLFPEAPELETRVLRQSTPTRFGEKYREPLATSPTIDLWLWTTVTHVGTDPGGPRVAVSLTPEGLERRFEGRALVLASGAIEATRTLLWSNQRNSTAVGNGGGLLGACYMDHLAGGAAFLHATEPVREKVYWSGIETHADDGVPLHFALCPSRETLEGTALRNVSFMPLPLSTDRAKQMQERRAKQADRSLRRLAKWVLGMDTGGELRFGEEYCRAITMTPDLVAERAIDLLGGDPVSEILLRFEAEQTPVRENKVTLDDTEVDAMGVPRPVVRWSPASDDIESVQEIARRIGIIAGREGLGRIEFETYGDDPYWGTTTAWHQMGTLRMADSPASGVVDRNCQVFGMPDLYVASGAVFPTVGRANPTLTIVALSLRLADHLKESMTA